jgi:hypothetical protein
MEVLSMDDTTVALIWLLKKIRRELRAIKASVARFRKGIQEPTETIEAANEHESQTLQQNTRGQVELRFADDTERARRAAGDRQYRLQLSIRNATWCAFLAATIYAAIAGLQLREMLKSNQATKSALEISQKQLELTERSWLTVDFAPESITFYEGGMQFALHARVTNIGHSVATGVVVPIEIFLASDAKSIFKEPFKRQKNLCDEIAMKPISVQQNETEMVVFPNDNVSLVLGLQIDKSEIESTPTANLHYNVKHILPIVVGCVDYQYGTSKRHHQTRFIYRVQPIDHTDPHLGTFEVGRGVPAANVHLSAYTSGGFFAD